LTAQQTAIRVRAKAYEKLIPEPSEQALADKIELLFPQYAQPSDRPNDRISCDILHQEGTGFQERYGTVISNSDPRKLVVCGTTVISARSRSP